MYAIIGGCVVSTSASVTPFMGENDAACQLQLWFYGSGFVITTSVLYIKMQQMQNIVDHSLKMTNAKLKTDYNKLNRILYVSATGETFILALWWLVAPLKFKRSCIEKQDEGVWDGICISSVGKCRTTQGPAFVGILSIFHICLIMIGIKKCYEVRNLPSIMAEGKWIFTGYYSQLQVFATAVPVLVMVRDDRETFTILKSLVICFGDLTTLGMLFVPKMFLIWKFYDFHGGRVVDYVSALLTDSSQKDSLYDSLKVEDPKKKKKEEEKKEGSVHTSGASSNRKSGLSSAISSSRKSATKS